MRSTFEPLGKYVRLVDERNTDMVTESVLGINIDKYFMPSVANVIGTDLSTYKLLRKGRFACNPMHVGRDGRLPVARYEKDTPAIVSPAYFMFEVIDEREIAPEYLMLCFRRPDFDRMCWFRTDASVRGGITWEDVCALSILVPPIDEQRKIVHDYQVVNDRMSLLQKMNEKIETLLYADFQRKFQTGKEATLKGTLLDGWQTGELSTLSEFQYGKMVPEEERCETGYPIFSGYGITGYYPEYMFADSVIVVLARGVSGTGEVRISPKYSYITNLSIALTLKDNAFFAYLYEYLAHDNLRALDSGSAQSMITIDSLNKYIIAIPPKHLAEEYNNVFNKALETIESNRNEIDILNKLLIFQVESIAKGE